MNQKEEIEEGRLTIENDMLICEHKYGMFNSRVNLNKLEYAYALVTVNTTPLLFLFDSHQHRIPINFKGFSNVYKNLTDRFGFDSDLFDETIKSDKPTKNRIWKREYNQNYVISDKELPIRDGIHVFDKNRTKISWDLPLANLLKFDFIDQYTDDYEQPSIRFLTPVQIGQIKIDELKANIAHNNTKSPVNNFYAKLRNQEGNDQSYYITKNVLSNSISKNPRISSHERTDQNHFNFIASDINISITYWYDDKHSYESNYTSLYIKNNREYPQLLINKDSLKLSDIGNYVVFSCALYTPNRYKENENIKEKPDVIKAISKTNPCIWFNKTKNTIGFSGSVYSQEFKKEEIESIHLRNIHPAKGSGSSNLELKIKQNNSSIYILRGMYKELDAYIEKIENVISEKILIEKEWADV